MADERARHRYLLVLLVCFLAVATWSGIAPADRETWLLENALVFPVIPILVVTRRRFPFSRISYTCMTVFLCLHEIGAHYTYAEVPYDSWIGSLGFERNHYDRLVHFSYGLLLAYPMREVVLRIARMRGFWGYFLPLDVTMSTSMIYELIEWAAAVVFGGETGMAYLGTQGDPWDAHKDMLLASLGALLTMTITVVVNWRMQRDFTREWVDSLSVHDPRPAGEEAIARMADRRR